VKIWLKSHSGSEVFAAQVRADQGRTSLIGWFVIDGATAAKSGR
jgi:hypothetical protein